MFKFIVPVCLSLAVICPTISNGQNYDCDDCDTHYQTRKKLALVDSTVEIKRLRRVCETDECGHSKNRLALVSEPVTFKRLALVDVPLDPCRPNFLDRMRETMSGLSFRNRGSYSDHCVEDCVEVCDDESWGHEIDYGTNGHYPAYDYSAPNETLFRQTAPRNSQSREVMPRNISPRVPADNYYVPQNSSSIIESPIPRDGSND